MAAETFTENGALIERDSDGTVKVRTAEGLRLVFPANPVSEPAPACRHVGGPGEQDRTGDGDG